MAGGEVPEEARRAQSALEKPSLLEFFFDAAVLENQEPERKHAERHVVMPADPGAHLVVVKAYFTFRHPESLFDMVPMGSDANKFGSVKLCAFRRKEVPRLRIIDV